LVGNGRQAWYTRPVKKLPNIASSDPQLAELVALEQTRQQESLGLIASENFPSLAVRQAVGSILTAKYAEGYPGKRYYAGNEIIDQVELLAIQRAKDLFSAQHVNVQPYSGSPANLAVYTGLLEIGDTIMGLTLTEGGHLTHGHTASFTGRAFKSMSYGVDPKTGLLDYDAIRATATKVRPKLIISGATAYPRAIKYDTMQSIAQEIGAVHLADISHVAGLVAAGVLQNPVPQCDVVTTTTHKTLRGPRGALIMCKEMYAKKIDHAVFPGLQGGPHEHTIAGIAVALKEASTSDFKEYARRTVDNAVALGAALAKHGFDLVTGGTDTHMLLIDLRNKKVTGQEAQDALSQIGITVNKNTIPGETGSALKPSGIRLGTPAITTRGAKPSDMVRIADWIATAIEQRSSKSVMTKTHAAVREFAQTLPTPA
jgi:glycine hydroxymethyltransferase